MAYYLHAWFKHSPCKGEDFIKSLEDSIELHESLFLKHVTTMWLTLSSEPHRIIQRWDMSRNYFYAYTLREKENAELNIQQTNIGLN